MKVGDLVLEAPFGKEWLQKNPWLTDREFGLVTKIIDHNNIMVLWPSGQLEKMKTQNLEKYSACR